MLTVMKTLITISLGLFSVLASAQTPAPSYTNGANTVPPYNGTTPPNTVPAPTITLPNSYPGSTGTYPIDPNSTSPTGSTTTYPTSPGVPQIQAVYLLLFQDPVRTPNNPRSAENVKTVDGSGGKYRSQHKFTPAKKNGFATNRRTKGVRSKAKVSRERTSN